MDDGWMDEWMMERKQLKQKHGDEYQDENQGWETSRRKKDEGRIKEGYSF